MSLHEEIEAALDAFPVSSQDRATAELALTYARRIDGHEPCQECECRGGGDISRLGPALLACLEALHMSPRARKAATKVVTSDQRTVNPLDTLAERRLRRGRAPIVDATAT